MIKISNRLKTIANLVLKEETNGIIDVGCDHGLLDIYLLQNNNKLKIIASDINKLPLESAKKNIEKYSFLNNIELKLIDGLKGIEDNIDTVVIAGMGKETIVKILKEDKEKLINVKRLIIASNSNIYGIRKEITNMEFIITDEKVVFEDDKYYVIEEFKKGKKKYTEEDLFLGPILRKDKESLSYYNYLKEKNREIINKIPENNKTRNELIKEIEMLNKVS